MSQSPVIVKNPAVDPTVVGSAVGSKGDEVALGSAVGESVEDPIGLEKQSCQPSRVTLPSEFHVNVSPALSDAGTAFADSTSTPPITKLSQQVSKLNVPPGVTFASPFMVTEHDSRLP